MPGFCRPAPTTLTPRSLYTTNRLKLKAMKISITLDDTQWNALMATLNALPYGAVFPLTPILQEMARQGKEQMDIAAAKPNEPAP